jgi:O-antigen ligase
MTMADSATALACLVTALGVLLAGRIPFLGSPGRIVTVTIAVALSVAVLDSTLGLTTTIIETLGRRPDLTTRVPMWEELLQKASSPLLGPGYEIFYLTDAGREMVDRWKVDTAHNGYLEIYLSSGIVGLFIFVVGIFAVILRIGHHQKDDFSGAVLRLALLVAIVLNNWTESTFRSVSNGWLLVFVASFDAYVLRKSLAASFGSTRPDPLSANMAAQSTRKRGSAATHPSSRTRMKWRAGHQASSYGTIRRF